MTNKNTSLDKDLDPSIPCGKNENPSKARFVKKMDEICCDEQKAYEYLFQQKFPNGFVCPICGCTEYYPVQKKRKGQRCCTEKECLPLFECKHCHHQESLYTGTVMHGSRLSPTVWMKAFRFFASDNTGITSHALAGELGVNYRTARLISRKIKTAMEETNDEVVLGDCDIAEIDCFMMGGKSHGKRGRGAGNKVFIEAIVGKECVERSNGTVAERNVGVKFRMMKSETAKDVEGLLRDVLFDPERQARLAAVVDGCDFDDETDYSSIPCTTAIRGDMSAANMKLSKSEVWRMDLRNSKDVKKDNYIQSLDHFISNVEANVRGSHHGIPRRCLVMELAECEYNHRNRDLRPMEYFEQIITDMMSHVGKSGRYMENRFRQIEANSFTLPGDPIMLHQNWDTNSRTAVNAF